MLINRMVSAAACGIALMLQPVLSQTVASTDASGKPVVAHVLMRPVQTELLGPDPLDSATVFGFRDLAWLTGLISVGAAGVALDGAIELASNDIELDKAARPLGQHFNFRETIFEQIRVLDKDTDFSIAEIHEYKYTGNCRVQASLLIRNAGADRVICLNPVWFVSPQLNQLRLRVEVGFLTGHDTAKVMTSLYARTYEYLSPSRGNLFRPFREGERETLIDEINRYYDQKTAQFPHNRNAYKKDREQALKALKDRDVIPPAMAVIEGWTADSISAELQVATDQIMKLVHADLLDPGARMPGEAGSVEFSALDLKGRPVRLSGVVIGSIANNMIYRDADGNVYSMPGN